MYAYINNDSKYFLNNSNVEARNITFNFLYVSEGNISIIKSSNFKL